MNHTAHFVTFCILQFFGGKLNIFFFLGGGGGEASFLSLDKTLLLLVAVLATCSWQPESSKAGFKLIFISVPKYGVSLCDKAGHECTHFVVVAFQLKRSQKHPFLANLLCYSHTHHAQEPLAQECRGHKHGITAVIQVIQTALPPPCYHYWP